MVTGIYLGLFVFDPTIKGGPVEWQGIESIMWISVGGFLGLLTGLLLDACDGSRRMR